MTVPVLAAAKRLARRSGWSLSNLELQKIIYLAHMFFIGRTGQPLVYGSFEAWDYGPVHPTLYHYAKIFGSDPVGDIFRHVDDIADDTPEAIILDEALRDLGHAGPGQLVAATHKEGGAWAINYVPGARHIVIPDEDIEAEYLGLDDNGGSGGAANAAVEPG